MRWAAGLSAAAAVIAVGIGFVSLIPLTRGAEDAGDSTANSAGGAAPQFADAPPPIASDRDYRPGSFSGLGEGPAVVTAEDSARTAASAMPGQVAGQPPGAAERGSLTVPPELARLTGPAARLDCLDAIRRAHGGTASVVEFARFAGEPALIVRLDGAASGNGAPWVVVAGPDCGRIPGDVDELYNGPLA
jgi:hypothetical protein